MLVHVTATHAEDNCPAYNRDKMPEVIQAMERVEEFAKECEVKIHFIVSAAPDHTTFALLEADTLQAIGRFLVDAAPFPQAFKITPVQTVAGVVEIGRALAASG